MSKELEVTVLSHDIIFFLLIECGIPFFGSPLFPIKDEVLLAYVYVRERKHASMCQRNIFTLTIHAAFLSSSICCSEHQGYTHV